eukprot:313168_1
MVKTQTCIITVTVIVCITVSICSWIVEYNYGLQLVPVHIYHSNFNNRHGNDGILPSCLYRILDCEGSFEFSTGHIKPRTNAYLYPQLSNKYYLPFENNEIWEQSKQCFLKLNAYTLAQYDNNFRYELNKQKTYTYKKTLRMFQHFFIYYHLFNITSNNKSPYFIELGAFDGITESNSVALELCANWDGLLIEGNPRIYTKLMDNRAHISKMLLVPSCLNDSSVIRFSSSAFSTQAGISHIVGINHNEGGYSDDIHCGPLQKYLHDLNIKNVEYFSLDVEGSEISVLKTIDFNQTSIDIWQIEAYNRHCRSNCSKRHRVRTFMTQINGYNLMKNYVSKDDIYIHPYSKFCQYLLKRIKYVSDESINITYFGDLYLKNNMQFIKHICTLKYSFVKYHPFKVVPSQLVDTIQ